MLEELARAECAERERRSLERRRRAAKLGRFKPIDEFDWNWPTKIDRSVLDRALSGELVRQRENLILVAAQGLGKTLLARNIAHEAVLQGHSALFIEASRMLLDLGAQESARALERRLRHYAQPELLCIDEVGYLSYDARAAGRKDQLGFCELYRIADHHLRDRNQIGFVRKNTLLHVSGRGVDSLFWLPAACAREEIALAEGANGNYN